MNGKRVHLRNSSKKKSKKPVKTVNKKEKIKISSKNYYLIQMDANNTGNKRPPSSDFLLDNYEYETAIKYDQRQFWRIFYILLLNKENIINIFLFKTPLDIFSLRICLFIFTYSCDLAFNTIFYSNANISDRYHYEGEALLLFSLVNNIVVSLTSFLTSLLLVTVFQHLIDSRKSYENIFRIEEKKMRKLKNYKVNQKTKIEILDKIKRISLILQWKIALFIISEFSLMLFFYYFVTAFCEVYKQTQISWLYDFFISFLISFAAEIVGSLFIAVFYMLSIKYRLKTLYRIIIFLYNI
jgi:hypothetical protein